MTNILPCPFCGEAPRVYPAQLMIDGECPESISCDNGDCLAGPSTGYLPLEDAIAAWNTRTPTPAPNAGAVKVKPLVWERGIVDYAKPLPGMKYISCSTTPHGCWAWWLDGDNSTRRVERDEQHAKSAAQQDYDARILSAIETTPDPRDAVIARLVEALQWQMGQPEAHPFMKLNASAALAAAKEVMK